VTGGIYDASGDLTIYNTTIGQNAAIDGTGGAGGSGGSGGTASDGGNGGNGGAGYGGLWYDYATGTLTMKNLTVVFNTVTAGAAGTGGAKFGTGTAGTAGTAGVDGAGGITVDAATSATIANSIVATNVAPVDPDVQGAFTSTGNNLLGTIGSATGFTNPTDQAGITAAQLNLAPLANNGGNTLTYALKPGSIALDAGSLAQAAPSPNDQRGPGFSRVAGASVDVGAFEFQAVTLSVTATASPTQVGQNGATTVTVVVTNTSGNPLPADGTAVTLTLSAGLSAAPGEVLTKLVGPLAPGASVTLTFDLVGTAVGGQTATVAVTSPDTTPADQTVVVPITVSAPAVQQSGFVIVSGSASGSAVSLAFNPDGTVATSGTSFTPFPGVPGIVRAASGDVDGDGVADSVYVTGPGGGDLVTVISGATGLPLVSNFHAFPGENFTNIGMFVAVGDIDGDGKADIVVSPDQGGGGRIQIFSFSGGTLVQASNFFGIDDPNFRGGARVALGDFNHDGTLDLAVAAGFTGGPRVALFDGKTLMNGGTPTRLVNDFFAFDGADVQNLRNGAFVAAGDFDGDGFADLVVSGGPNGGPRVQILSGALLMADDGAVQAHAAPVGNFFAFDANERGGVSVATATTPTGDLDLFVGDGQNSTGAVNVYKAATVLAAPDAPTPDQVLNLFGGEVLTNGVFVG
jgi:hypothetical protein